MNLLRDPWIPVQSSEGFNLISLEEVLCSENDYSVSLSRDDLEMAVLQLAICLIQVSCMPEDKREWKERYAKPLRREEYRQRTEGLCDWFVLDHPKHPFMQDKSVQAKKNTPIQKLIPGLPAGNNHCWFNAKDEIELISENIAGVVLFQQASNSPSFGGGFKSPLRGNAPITTLIWDKSLRKLVWGNILTKETIRKIFPDYSISSEREIPTWVHPIEKKEVSHDIGLLRGLFWQPAKLKLLWLDCCEKCDLLGRDQQKVCKEFVTDKFSYDFDGTWPHPHSPRDLEKEIFDSFRSQMPAWLQCEGFLYAEKDNKGHIPALVISQAKELFLGKPLHLIVGGYCNKQASVLERRHELLTFGTDWQGKGEERLKRVLQSALQCKKILAETLKGVKNSQSQRKTRGLGISLAQEAERLFYQRTERYIQNCFREYTVREFKDFRASLRESLQKICLDLFDEVTGPYLHDAAMVATIALGRRRLNTKLYMTFVDTKGR